MLLNAADFALFGSMRRALASLKLDTSLLRVRLALKAGFDASQPRVPSGNSNGGPKRPGVTMISARVAPSNSLLCISDRGEAVIPEYDGKHLIVASSSFIFVGCLMFQDGETTVTIGSAAEMATSAPPAFDSFLDTPQRTVQISTIEGRIVLGTETVATDRTRVRIWVNHPTEPDQVLVALG